MNHPYDSIQNEAQGAWITVFNTATSAFKYHKLLASSLLICSTSSWALPTGDQLVAGQATVSTPTANVMQIDQASQQAIINWQTFSIAQNQAVNIQQPNANAALLNRVVGQDASQIQGQLNANGQVYLVNPNGVLFGKTAQVDVGGLIATTSNISNADFLSGKPHFTQSGKKAIIDNQGAIKTPVGGVVALIGQNVSNTGTINTPKGTTALTVGKTVDLDFKGDGLVEVTVSESALNAQITNKGAIQADGGRVVLTAQAVGQLIDTVLNQEGIIRAQGLVERNGEIILNAEHITQTGNLDASGITGGTVDINGRTIVNTGIINADGTVGNGGKITQTASNTISQSAEGDTHANGTSTGGTIHLDATNSLTGSGKLSATGEQGGTIDMIAGESVTLAAAKLDVSGSQKGGLIRVGGDFHDTNTGLPIANTTRINSTSTLKADGGNGKVVIWSNQQTDYNGSISANKVGNIEISSKGTVNYAGAVDGGVGGYLLIDPKNIVISTLTTGLPTSSIVFSNATGTTIPVNVGAGFGLAATLALGTNITLQANNDITLNTGTTIDASNTKGNNGGNLILQAGRNISLNASINTANGNFTAIAGDPSAIATDRDLGTATIALNSGATINAGTGKVTLAAINGNFINNTGSTAPITASQWLIYSTDPRLNSLNGMIADNKHYGQSYGGEKPDYANTGNWFLYSITPTLSVTPSSQTIDFGTTPANFTPSSFTGFIDGDSIGTAGISGTGIFNIANFTGAVGFYDVAYQRGLASRLGYVFANNTASLNELTVKPVSSVIVTPVIPLIPVAPVTPDIPVSVTSDVPVSVTPDIPSTPTVNPVVQTTEPVIQIKLINSNTDFLQSQISPLQRSTILSPWLYEKVADDKDALDIVNNGLKLPIKLHTIISLSMCSVKAEMRSRMDTIR
jgi:filamentous hemagglutinin family protein